MFKVCRVRFIINYPSLKQVFPKKIKVHATDPHSMISNFFDNDNLQKIYRNKYICNLSNSNNFLQLRCQVLENVDNFLLFLFKYWIFTEVVCVYTNTIQTNLLFCFLNKYKSTSKQREVVNLNLLFVSMFIIHVVWKHGIEIKI